MPFVSIFPPLRLRAWCNFSPLCMLPRILTPPDGNAHFESFRLFQQMYSVQHYICVFLSLSAVFNLGVSLLVYLTTISLSLSFCFQKVVEEESQVRKPSLDICSTGDKLADADPARKVSYHFPPCDTFPHSFPPPSSTLRYPPPTDRHTPCSLIHSGMLLLCCTKLLCSSPPPPLTCPVSQLMPDG